MPDLALIAKLAQQQRQGRSAYEVARDAGFSGTMDQWVASLRGPRGFEGPSAYDVAVRSGYSGTQEEWVAYLKGDQGPRGPKGDSGQRGPKGDTGPAPEHEWRGTELRFMHPDGEWGRFVDLKGPKGDGTQVAFGGAGPVILPSQNSYMPSGW